VTFNRLKHLVIYRMAAITLSTVNTYPEVSSKRLGWWCICFCR